MAQKTLQEILAEMQEVAEKNAQLENEKRLSARKQFEDTITKMQQTAASAQQLDAQLQNPADLIKQRLGERDDYVRQRVEERYGKGVKGFFKNFLLDLALGYRGVPQGYLGVIKAEEGQKYEKAANTAMEEAKARRLALSQELQAYAQQSQTLNAMQQREADMWKVNQRERQIALDKSAQSLAAIANDHQLKNTDKLIKIKEALSSATMLEMATNPSFRASLESAARGVPGIEALLEQELVKAYATNPLLKLGSTSTSFKGQIIGPGGEALDQSQSTSMPNLVANPIGQNPFMRNLMQNIQQRQQSPQQPGQPGMPAPMPSPMQMPQTLDGAQQFIQQLQQQPMSPAPPAQGPQPPSAQQPGLPQPPQGLQTPQPAQPAPITPTPTPIPRPPTPRVQAPPSAPSPANIGASANPMRTPGGWEVERGKDIKDAEQAAFQAGQLTDALQYAYVSGDISKFTGALQGSKLVKALRTNVFDKQTTAEALSEISLLIERIGAAKSSMTGGGGGSGRLTQNEIQWFKDTFGTLGAGKDSLMKASILTALAAAYAEMRVPGKQTPEYKMLKALGQDQVPTLQKYFIAKTDEILSRTKEKQSKYMQMPLSNQKQQPFLNPETGKPATLADGLAGKAVNARGQKIDPEKVRAQFNKLALADKEVGFTHQTFGKMIQDIIKEALKSRITGGAPPNAR